MNALNHFEQNRPVHLACRDVHFELALELFMTLDLDDDSDIDPEVYRRIMDLFNVSHRHAGHSIVLDGDDEPDEQFQRFLGLVISNMNGMLPLISFKEITKETKKCFFGFLGGQNLASVALQAEECLHRAGTIVRSMRNTMELALDPFLLMKQRDQDALTEAGRERYIKARSHFEVAIKTSRKCSRKQGPIFD